MSGGVLNDTERRVLALLASDFLEPKDLPATPRQEIRYELRSITDQNNLIEGAAGTGYEMGGIKWSKEKVFELLKTAAYGSEKEPRDLAIRIIDAVAHGYLTPEEGGGRDDRVALTTVAQYFFDQARTNAFGISRGVSTNHNGSVLAQLVALNRNLEFVHPSSGAPALAFGRRDSESSTDLRDSPKPAAGAGGPAPGSE